MCLGSTMECRFDNPHPGDVVWGVCGTPEPMNYGAWIGGAAVLEREKKPDSCDVHPQQARFARPSVHEDTVVA